ncbi:MAG: LysE family translocator [SAR324 cluster bacterium]|nr:LysE family translocator [SAR324 cluster bacterium]
MPELTTLVIFFVAALALIVTPGPAVLYVVARSIDQGRLAGVISTLGVASGTVIHIAAAAFGISALLVSSALAFNIMKYLGAAYLIFLGIRKFFSPEEFENTEFLKAETLRSIFYQGFWVNLLNPKTALFFFAFLPQFVDPAKGSPVLQVLFFGIIFVVLGIVSDGVWAILAGSLRNWLKENQNFLTFQRYFAGTVFIVLGVLTALSGGAKK